MRNSFRRVVAATVVAGFVFGVMGLAAGQTASTAGSAAQTPDGGRVIAKGPGYSIVATGGGGASQAGETAVTDARLETLREPIICRGDRVLSIDNRNIRFEGNAITAEDGCELHIINSRISATGVAVRARNASVHIENSEIEGRQGSIDAARGAQIYAETSTFRGAARRLGEAVIHDLGNNNWD
jgi:hypothetical protein